MFMYGVNSDVNHVKQPNIIAFATFGCIDSSNIILEISWTKGYNKHPIIVAMNSLLLVPLYIQGVLLCV